MTSQPTGRWRIDKMDLWDLDAIDLLGPAFIEINTDGTGSLRFIAVQGFLDCRFDERDRQPVVEFSWDGDDEGHPASGRGWAREQADGSLHGHIFFHMGDDSWFQATRDGGLTASALPAPDTIHPRAPTGRRPTPPA